MTGATQPKGVTPEHTQRTTENTPMTIIKNILNSINAALTYGLLLILVILKRKQINETLERVSTIDTTSREYAIAVCEMVKRMGELDTEGLYKTDDQKFEAARMIVQESMQYDELSAAEIAADIDGLIARSAEFYGA